MRIVAAILALATAGATLTVSSVPALAEEPRQVIVQYSDLNLAAPAGRATLDARIRGAARRVCGALPTASVKEIQQTRNCQVAAAAQAWDRMTATASSGQERRAR
ncbi:MAG TPA: UrcA family protein [Allosphingosinicella sp.]|jgi:UrcA family protein|nr:UrcA family protein [Allosphingosinicella sp.]